MAPDLDRRGGLLPHGDESLGHVISRKIIYFYSVA
jgi:hypothetical protein